MIPALLSPAALGALLAVLVPLAIHIARRTETQVIDFAALRWLNPNPRPVRRLRLNERLLLAVRIALVIVVVLALAEPALRPTGDGRAVIAVSPAVDAKTVPDHGERRVWLAPGFPGLDRPAPTASAPFASLVRQLDAETPGKTPITIVAPPELTGDAERLYLSRKVDWRIGAAPARSKTVTAPAPPALTVRYAPGNERAVGYFRAAATAYAEAGKPPAFEAALADSPVPHAARYLVWLSGAPMSAATLNWIEAGGVALLAHDAPSPVEGAQSTVWRDAEGAPLATAGRFGKGRVLRLTLPLEPSAMPILVEPDFPEQLWTLLAPPPAPSLVAATDYAPSVRPAAGGVAYNPHPVSLRPWLTLLIALIFAAERWLATRRDRPVAA
jgi:hypothetical protein